MQTSQHQAGMAPFGLRALARSVNRRRTSPLWGLGMGRSVNPDAGFLHNGTARTVEQAVLWHDGEGSDARNRFLVLEGADRELLLIFLESL